MLSTADQQQQLTTPPLVLRRKTKKMTDISNHCCSVSIECSSVELSDDEGIKSHSGIYELSASGWSIDSVESSPSIKRNEFCIDEQINGLLAVDCNVSVTFGNIKLTF